VMHEGQIVRSGAKDLALELESKGYDWLKAGQGERKEPVAAS
jgi:Fe-S cluster assembly ATPase SufC